MNSVDVKFHDCIIKEQTNISGVELFAVKNNQDTMAIRLKKEAMVYCKGASEVLLTKKNGGAEETMEGPCVFSFFQETKEEMSNIQFFPLYQYGAKRPLKDIVVIRKSKWNRKNDMASICDGGKILHPTFEGASVVLTGKVARQLLLDTQQIGTLFYSGFSCSRSKNEEFGVYSLKVTDTLDVVHELHWDNKIQLHPIEEKTKMFFSNLEEQLHAQILNDLRLKFVFH